MKKYIFIFASILLALFTLFLFQYFSLNDGKLHIVICNVGQGDAIFIRTPSESDILIDGGPDDSVLACLSSHMPFWDRRLEAVILTHPHADHETGLISVLKRYQVLSFNTEKVPSQSQTFKSLMTELAEKKVIARYLTVGDRFTEENNFSLNTIWPSSEVVMESGNKGGQDLDLNGFSVVELLTYRHFKALFTGDAGIAIGERLSSGVGKVNFLKVPHHGSRTGMDEVYLGNLRPDLAAISVGAKNKYGHPSALSLELLKNAGVKTLRTDLDGEIEIVTDGERWSYKTQNSHNSL